MLKLWKRSSKQGGHRRHTRSCINSSLSRATYTIHQWTGSALVQVMACRHMSISMCNQSSPAFWTEPQQTENYQLHWHCLFAFASISWVQYTWVHLRVVCVFCVTLAHICAFPSHASVLNTTCVYSSTSVARILCLSNMHSFSIWICISILRYSPRVVLYFNSLWPGDKLLLYNGLVIIGLASACLLFRPTYYHLNSKEQT